MKWFTLNENKEINLFEELLPFTKEGKVIFHIGTDAQARGTKAADFVTVVCVHMIDEYGVGKGGRVLFWKDKNIPTHSLWEKLYGETERSLRIATQLTEKFGYDIANRILVHVDANPDTKYASSKHADALAGMVMGYGFKYILKPDAFAASHAADHIVKNKN